jgi:hypothetical protein
MPLCFMAYRSPQGKLPVMTKDKKNMSPTSIDAKPSTGFAERSSLYQEFLAEREEILRHKWIESEKKGKDIGFERALLDWIRKHRENWRNERSPRRK